MVGNYGMQKIVKKNEQEDYNRRDGKRNKKILKVRKTGQKAKASTRYDGDRSPSRGLDDMFGR